MNTTAAVLGLGAMGLPMATWLARTMPVNGFDVSAERLELARRDGVRPAATAAEASRDVDVVVVGVRDAAQLRSVLLGADGAQAGLHPGAVVLITSTVGASAVIEVASQLRSSGVETVDGPVSGGPVRAGKGDLLIMIGATPEALERARPVLDVLASTVTVVGPQVGAGQQMKTVNQLLCGIHTAAAAEALVLAYHLGLDVDAAIEVLGKGAAASFMLADRGPRIAQQLLGVTPTLRSRLDVIAKDMGIVGDLTRTLHLATPVAAAAEQLFRFGMAAGLASEDDSKIATTLAQPGSAGAIRAGSEVRRGGCCVGGGGGAGGGGGGGGAAGVCPAFPLRGRSWGRGLSLMAVEPAPGPRRHSGPLSHPAVRTTPR
jgi:3-hydroxyisobutyrate dehydrogenase